MDTCEGYGKEYRFADLKLLAGTGNPLEVNESNGLTVSKWACPVCGKSVDFFPVSETVGKLGRFHTPKVHRDTNRKSTAHSKETVSSPAGSIPALAIFLQAIAGKLMFGNPVEALSEIYQYAERVSGSVVSKRETVAKLRADLEIAESEYLKLQTEIREKVSRFIPETEKARFDTVFPIPEPKPEPEPQPETVQ